nr:Maf family protein [Geoalkalibacter subterraneus]
MLASASPRRRELLESLGIQLQIIPSCVDEGPLEDEEPAEHVMRLSREKAQEVANRADVKGRWFLGSDTIVVQDGHLLGKPCDTRQAGEMLRMLSGREHQVYSGYAIHDRKKDQSTTGSVCTQVRLRQLTGAEIAGYIASGEPLDKAGAYAIQGLASYMVSDISGSYTNVVGLPLAEVVDVLLNLGAITLPPQHSARENQVSDLSP